MPSAGRDGLDEWYQRVAREFGQCPGLRLTTAQAARLWALDRDRVEQIFEALVSDRLLFRTPNGAFVARGACPRCE